MIDSGQTFAPSEEVVKKAREVKVERLSECQYRVVPNDPAKRTRIVELEFIEDDDYPEDNQLLIDCYDEETFEGCPANDHRKVCYHYWGVKLWLEAEESES